MRVARVFPDGFDAALEEVHAVPQGESGGVEVVEDGPEGADVVDGGEADEAVFVRAGRRGVVGVVGGGAVLSVVPEVPAVHEGWGAVLLQARLQETEHFCAARGWRGDVGCGGGGGGRGGGDRQVW